MNRKIFFRGKRVDNGEWVVSDSIMQIKRQNPRLWVEHEGLVEVIRETVGQYTGLKDKNRNKIFEGDILQTEGPDGTDYRDVVCFGRFNDDNNRGNEYMGFYVKSGNYTTSLLEMPLGKHNYCCVIGNIHDNLERLG